MFIFPRTRLDILTNIFALLDNIQKNGASERTWTSNVQIKSLLCYLLHHEGIWWCFQKDSNLHPKNYEFSAPPLSYGSMYLWREWGIMISRPPAWQAGALPLSYTRSNGPDRETWTPDTLLPKQARYRLRHIRNNGSSSEDWTRICGLKARCSVQLNYTAMAEGVGFEPTEGFPSVIFKTTVINHSTNPLIIL